MDGSICVLETNTDGQRAPFRGGTGLVCSGHVRAIAHSINSVGHRVATLGRRTAPASVSLEFTNVASVKLSAVANVFARAAVSLASAGGDVVTFCVDEGAFAESGCALLQTQCQAFGVNANTYQLFGGTGAIRTTIS